MLSYENIPFVLWNLCHRHLNLVNGIKREYKLNLFAEIIYIANSNKDSEITSPQTKQKLSKAQPHKS